MQYRKFGRLDWQASALGFGCMRLPVVDSEDRSKIDEAEATRMLHYAIDHGLNYVDTAYGYHHGESERFVGRVLQGGYRQKVHLATKLPIWHVNGPEDFDRLLNEQLEKLQTEWVDFYLLHGLDADGWKKVYQFGVLDWAEKAKASGRIHNLGFSFHDEFPVFKEIVDSYPWAMCQIQHNYMDIEHQAGTQGLRYAASQGLAVVIMEPLLGGRLAKAPAQVQAVWEKATRRRTPADWALQWLWDQPEVSVVLSGMSTMQQVEENIASAAVSGPGSLTEEERKLVEQARQTYEGLCPIPCTQCEYCLPCPNGVKIPVNFRIYNDGAMYGDLEEARRAYQHWLKDDERASCCEACRECEEKCPQHIPISEWMPLVQDVLGGNQPYPSR